MLRGAVTGLRAVEEADLPQLLAWRNQPDFRLFFREYRELNKESQMQWFHTKVMGDEHTRMFAITNLVTDELLGACGLCYIDWVNRNADFSIYIGKNHLYIDDVLAIDAARVMIRYAFDELNLHRLWSEIYSIDERKKEMFRTLGFTHEASLRETHWTEGRWVDSWYYRLLRDENRIGSATDEEAGT